MKHSSVVALVCLGFAALLGGAATARADPACTGSDLIPMLQEQYPDNYRLYRSEADRITNNGANLWRIQGSEGTPASWLYGTIHVADPRVTQLPEPVQQVAAVAP